MAIILREGATSRSIDFVFDVYRETSVNNAEIEKRGGGGGIHANRVQQKCSARSLNPTMKEVLIEP